MKRIIVLAFLWFSSFIVSAAESIDFHILVWTPGYVPEAQVNNFKKIIMDKYKVNVNVIPSYVRGPDHIFNVLRGGEVAVASVTHNLIDDERYSMIKNRLIHPIEIEEMSNYKTLIDALKKHRSIYQDGKYYGAPFQWGPYGIMYNSDKVKRAPTEWEDIFDPVYRGKYTASKHYEANVYAVALSVGYKAEDINNYDALIANKLFMQRIYDLAKYADGFWVVDTPDILKGRPISLGWALSLYPLRDQVHENWVLATLKEGTLAWMDPYVISTSVKKGSMLYNVAREWLNYSLSVDYQINASFRKISCFPTIKHDLYKAELTDKEKDIFHMRDPKWADNNLILWPTFSARTRNGFRDLWNDAMSKNKTAKDFN